MTTTQPLVRSLAGLALAAGLSTACKKDKAKHEAPESAASSEASTQPAAEVFTGALTPELILASEGTVKPFDNWAVGFAALQAKLGAPTNVSGNTYSWAVKSNDSCTYVYVSKDNEAEFFKDKKDPQDMIGAVSSAMTTGPDIESHWNECLRAASAAKPEAAIDPNAPLPPGDGMATVATLRAGLAGATSRWVGKSLTVDGVLQSVSSSSENGSDVETVTLTIGATVDSAETIRCTLISGATAPELKPGSPIKVSGKTTDSAGGGLDDCAMLAE